MTASRNRKGLDAFDILLFLSLVLVGSSPLFMR